MGAMHLFLLQQRGVVEFNDLHRPTPDTALSTTTEGHWFPVLPPSRHTQEGLGWFCSKS